MKKIVKIDQKSVVHNNCFLINYMYYMLFIHTKVSSTKFSANATCQ